MKTLAILMMILAGCADALPGDGAADGPVSGEAGGAQAGTGGAQAQTGTGGMSAPEVPCDSQYGEVRAFDCHKTSPGGNPCGICVASENSAQFSGGCIDTNGAAVQHFYCSVGACEDCH